MDYAAALRNASNGPAAQLNLTPATKAQPTKASPKPAPKPVEVEEAPITHEEEKINVDAVSSAPSKAPNSHGLVPVVRFGLIVPSSAPANKIVASSSTDVVENDTDSSEETEEDETNEEGATNGTKSGSKASSGEGKAPWFTAQDLENNFSRLSDLVTHLERNAEDRSWELEGGFRFSKSNKNNGKPQATRLTDMDLPTVTLSLKWLSAIVELLRSKSSTNIVVGGGAFISVACVDNQLRVIRFNKTAGKDVWLQFDDVVLDIREQAKLYLQVANRIEQILERRESQLADKERKDAAKKRRVAISNKLHTAAFTSMLDALQSLLTSSTEFSGLAKKFNDQEAHLAQQRRRLKEENQDMNNILFASVSSTLLEQNFQHIAASLEPEEPVVDASAETVETNKKLSKKEAAAVAAAEAERKKQAEEEAEVARKAADAVRRKRAEDFAAQQAADKRRQISANPFANLEAASEDSLAAMAASEEEARLHQIKKTQQAKVAQKAAKDKESANAAAVAQQQKLAAVEKAKKVAEKTEKKSEKTAAASPVASSSSASSSNNQKKPSPQQPKVAQPQKAPTETKAQKAAKEQAIQEAAQQKKAEKAQKAAAEKAAAVVDKPAPSSKAEKKSGPDRSEKQRKAEKIEADKLEKQKSKQMKQVAKRSKTDNTTLYATIAGGGAVALIVLYFLYTQFVAKTAAV